MNIEVGASGLDIIRPNLHGVSFTHFTEYQHEQHLYAGFEIATYGTYHDVRVLRRYKAALISPNEVAVQLPAMNSMFHREYRTWRDHVVEGSNFHCERLFQGHTENGFKIKNNPLLQVRILVFTFPDEIRLSNSIFSPDALHGNLVTHRVPMMENVTTNRDTFEQHQIRMAWKVHITQRAIRQVGEEDDFVELDDMIGGMVF